ncbi:hypothetical protein G5714_021941 [Onychostoma macrolepis]|uniref:Uncharacterized protein n=1 Tax=Onychostoma macrolepis TaxID=369639 RepID=A0A7J6BTU3_9TELE|nr:hypothetical protein G5714_021941 [Onychostoma macrolepis]
MSHQLTCTFTTFGKSRRIPKSLEPILLSIDKFAKPGSNIKDYSVYDDADLWGDVCKDLEVPNTFANRVKIRKATAHLWKDGSDVGDWESPLLEQDNECSFSFEKDALPESDAAITSHLVKPETQQLECKSAFPDQKDNDKESDLPESTYISTESSEAEDKFFRCSLPQEPCFFFIDKKEWQDLRKHQKGRCFQGLQWTNVIAKGIRSIHPYCSFGFKRHSVKTQQSLKNTPLFKCTGYCRFEDCPVNVTVEVTDEVTLKTAVLFTGGDVCHKTLESKLPRSVYLDSMQKLPEMVMQSGCRDEAPTKEVLKTISWSQRQLKRPHSNELLSLQMLINEQKGSDNEVLQRVMMHLKGIMLWSKKTQSVFYKRWKEDIVYLDATGSVIQKGSSASPPYYVYELVVRNPSKGASPLPVATYLTCDHTTASVTYFLQAFQTDMMKLYGKKAVKRPIMIICDGSLVLLNSISFTFCKLSLEDLLQKYFEVITGQYQAEKFDLPILHRCLSHIIKNAKDLCKNSDIGRHGTGSAYQHFSKIYKEVSQSNKQVTT